MSSKPAPLFEHLSTRVGHSYEVIDFSMWNGWSWKSVMIQIVSVTPNYLDYERRFDVKPSSSSPGGPINWPCAEHQLKVFYGSVKCEKHF